MGGAFILGLGTCVAYVCLFDVGFFCLVSVFWGFESSILYGCVFCVNLDVEFV